MNQSSSPQSDNNSAVVINQDGKVECHIIDDDKNTNHRDESVLREKTAIDGTHLTAIESTQSLNDVFSQLRQSKLIPYLILTLLLTILLMGQYIYSNYSRDIGKQQAKISSKAKVIEESPAVSEIKVIAKLLYDEDKLNLSVLQMFNEKWNQLDEIPKQTLKNSFWFSRFSELLQDKIQSHQIMAKNSLDKQGLSKPVISKTTTIIGMPLVDDIAVDQKGHAETKLDAVFDDITSEIAKVEAEKIAIRKNDTALPEAIPVESKSTQGFTESDANYLLGQYAATYEFGKTKRLLSYFSANRNYRNRLQSVFKKVFKQSSNRRIEFSELKWTFEKNTIVGKGKYRAKIKLKNNKGTRYVNADIKINLKPKKENLKITNMDFFNVDVDLKKSSKKTKKKRVSKSKSTPNPKTQAQLSSANSVKGNPTKAELQDIVSRFTVAYESGNLTEFDNIFSKDIKTNRKNGLRGLKQDYIDLFRNTTDRQLFIEGLNWSFDTNSAKGTGKLSILLISQGSNKIRTRRGEIQIVAKKTNKKTMITRLYQNFE